MSSLTNIISLLCLAIKYGSGNKLGRTKLQKMIYFADKYLRWDISDFKLHYYGPYSENIASTIQTIKNELIQETIPEFGPYDYQLLDKGYEFLENFEQSNKDNNKIETTIKIFTELSKWEKADLELVATIDYVYRNSMNKTRDKIVEKVSIIKDKDNLVVEDAYDKWVEWKKYNNFN